MAALGSPVSATTVHPGGIRTDIARSARTDEPEGAPTIDADRMLRTELERAAEAILRAGSRNRRRVLVGPDANIIDAASRLSASLYQRAVARFARRALEQASVSVTAD
jgi:short-subunit dehydrogenase